MASLLGRLESGNRSAFLGGQEAKGSQRGLRDSSRVRNPVRRGWTVWPWYREWPRRFSEVGFLIQIPISLWCSVGKVAGAILRSRALTG